ncbi:MAG: hypothetical protein OXE17_09850 [Chloroflexi bacterium]|nr:hypothetical protein [Chloroflexota bacterium]
MHIFRKGKLVLLAGLLTPALILAAACGASAPSEPASPTSEDAAPSAAVAVSFMENRLTPETIQVKQGDDVVLNLETDRPGTFHIHGYDLQKDAVVGEVSEFQFVADATGRFRINFHSAPDQSTGSMEHMPMESAVPVSISVSADVVDGGVHVKIDTDGWDWLPEEVNGANIDGAGHAHIYADGVKLSRVYGPYHYVPDLATGEHEIKVSLNSNDHSELSWQGALLEAKTSITIPDATASADHGTPRAIESIEADAPMSLEVTVHEDPLGGYNVQVQPVGFEFSSAIGQSHMPNKGYAMLSIDGEEFNRMYVSWFQTPAQGEGVHTFTVALLNNLGMPYVLEGQPVETSVQVQEGPKGDATGGSQAGHHDASAGPNSPDSMAAAGGGSGAGHHADGSDASAGHHNGGGNASSVEELEVGYLEVLPR